jgi:hypothetical protein
MAWWTDYLKTLQKCIHVSKEFENTSVGPVYVYIVYTRPWVSTFVSVLVLQVPYQAGETWGKIPCIILGLIPAKNESWTQDQDRDGMKFF